MSCVSYFVLSVSGASYDALSWQLNGYCMTILQPSTVSMVVQLHENAPIDVMADAGGPTKAIPFSWHSLAKPAFSDRKP